MVRGTLVLPGAVCCGLASLGNTDAKPLLEHDGAE